MVIKPYLQKRWQKFQWNSVKVSAGPRYTSEVDIELPIRGLFEGLGRTKSFFDEVKELKTNLDERVESSNKRNNQYLYNVKHRLPKIYMHARAISKILRDISKDSSMDLPFNQIPPRANFIFRHLRAIQDITYKLEEKEEQKYRETQEVKTDEEKSRISYRKDSDYLSSLKYLVEDLRKLSSIVRDIETLAKSPKARLANEPFVLLLGEAGMGKTHLLCDVIKNRLEDGYPTFMVLGEEIPKISSPVKSLLKSRKISETEAAFLREINNYGARKRRNSQRRFRW